MTEGKRLKMASGEARAPMSTLVMLWMFSKLWNPVAAFKA
jgi:hypothetical protein